MQHILLSNPSMFECHILEFLRRPESHSLISTKDKRGFTPLQLAFKILRPATIEALLSLGASLSESPADPDGYTPLHRIASLCLTRHIPLPAGYYSVRLLPQPLDFLPACKRLWNRCLDTGMDINALDGTLQGNPPLFHYLAHHANTVKHPQRWLPPDDFKSDLKCHVANFDDFLATADLQVKNKLGDGALHIVAWNETGLGGYEPRWSVKRPQKHDAEVMRFLVTEKGLDPLLEDAKGRSSLDLAAHLQREAILDLFKQKN